MFLKVVDENTLNICWGVDDLLLLKLLRNLPRNNNNFSSDFFSTRS